MKKTISFVLSLVTVAAALTACGGHSHKDDPWKAELDGHYRVCEKDGEKLDEGKHTLDGENRCTECGATLHAYSPSELELSAYNKYGLRDYYVEYRMGKEVLRRVYEYEYKKGEPVSYKTYEGTELYEEGIVIKKDGEYKRLRTKRNYDDSYSIRTYDKEGFLTSVTDYTKAGKVMREEKYVYERDSKGVVSRTHYVSDKKVSIEKYALNEEGELYISENIGYTADGAVKYIQKYRSNGYSYEYVAYKNGEIDYVQNFEYVFDEDGNRLSYKLSVNGTLCYEYTYIYASYEYAYPKTTLGEYKYYTQYGQTYVTTYDDYGEPVLLKIVDSDGKTVRETKTEYTRDDLGRMTLEKELEGDRVLRDVVYEYDGDSDDRSKITETYYYEDGRRAVTVYNGNYDVISRTDYDAEGEIVKNETYEHVYDEYGNKISEKTYSDGVLVEEKKWAYDEDGNTTCEETYENGALVEKREYLPDGSGNTYGAITTTYEPDGGKRVIHRLENGDISLDIQYNSDGSYFHYFKYTFVTNDDGTETCYTHDENGNLLSEYREDADGNRIEYITYHSEGKSVEHYNENGDLELRCEYDSDGKLTAEITYDGDYNAVTETRYHDEGKTVITHNGDGTVTVEIFDNDGNLISSETVE